ncbi:hypothetical protein AB6A23_10495 [Paenibacillus tarimensis]
MNDANSAVTRAESLPHSSAYDIDEYGLIRGEGLSDEQKQKREIKKECCCG